jgi:hypothetical protein
MLLNQLIFFSILFLCVYVSIQLRRMYRKIGTILLVLTLVVFVISVAGTIKFSILDSMNLDLNPSIIVLDNNPEIVSSGESTLDKLKRWNKIIRGKKPIYTTKGGTQFNVNPIGDEKSIKLFKLF